jgi:hypothetical protein
MVYFIARPGADFTQATGFTNYPAVESVVTLRPFGIPLLFRASERYRLV